jgi:hypothetical protein
MDFNREFRLNSSQIQHLFVKRQLDETLANLTTIEDIVPALHFGIENLQREKDKEITS